MKVKNLFININLEQLDALSDDPYWEKANGFVSEVWEDDISQLSQKQPDWLDTIDDKMARMKGH